MEQIERKKLYFRSCHRGNKEMDIILSAFAERHLATMTDEEMVIYREFLEEPDVEIWDWLIGKAPPTNDKYQLFLQKMSIQG